MHIQGAPWPDGRAFEAMMRLLAEALECHVVTHLAGLPVFDVVGLKVGCEQAQAMRTWSTIVLHLT